MEATGQHAQQGAKVFEQTSLFVNTRGNSLHVLQLRPSALELRGVLVYHHGFGEHCDRHLRVLRQLAVRLQMLIVTYDAHGHGRSGPHLCALRAYVHDWYHLADDYLDIVEKVALPSAKEMHVPASHVFAAGYSMGGMTVVLAALQKPALFRGILLSSPLISVTPKNSYGEWAQIAALRVLALLVPYHPLVKRRPVDAAIRDPQAVKEVLADNLWYRGPIKVGTVVSFINGTLMLQKHARYLQLPMYIQQGTQDQTCNVECMRRLLPHIGSSDVTYHEVKGAFHDLLHDPETPACLDRMVAWVQAHM